MPIVRTSAAIVTMRVSCFMARSCCIVLMARFCQNRLSIAHPAGGGDRRALRYYLSDGPHLVKVLDRGVGEAGCPLGASPRIYSLGQVQAASPPEPAPKIERKGLRRSRSR